MEFNKKVKIERNAEYDHLEKKYPHNVLLYEETPTDTIKLEEFEQVALQRLQVLRIYEQAQARGLRLLTDEWKSFVQSELSNEGLKGYLRLITNAGIGNNINNTTNSSKYEFELESRRKDYLSHFILRLVYCRSTELIRWFVTRELELFKHKFSSMTASEIKHFIKLHQLNYMPLSQEEKQSLKEDLIESTVGYSAALVETLDFYKVPFTQVLDLVRTRRCLVHRGYCYITIHDVISIAASKQQELIENGLDCVKLLINEVDTDERLYRFIKSLHTSYTGKDYTISKNASVPIECLDDLSNKSFPLCMKVCHEHIRTHHHLKHAGRMQYGLFLKGIGVTMEDSVRFWRDEFIKMMDAEKFAKNYQYNIEHNYGKRGSMTNYTPHSCLKIIKEVATPGSANGCPYRLYDQNTLRQKLSSIGLSVAHIQDVMQYVAKGHYQLACGKFFQISHNSPDEVAINHPNQYFELSQTLMGQRGESKTKRLPSKTAKKNDLDTVFDNELWDVDMPIDNEENLSKTS
ncbi:DNA primase subunit 2 [Glossina fuscipes fuscipes]